MQYKHVYLYEVSRAARSRPRRQCIEIILRGIVCTFFLCLTVFFSVFLRAMNSFGDEVDRGLKSSLLFFTFI